jgi:hypothetical protein
MFKKLQDEKLPAVPEINLNSLVEKQGGLEEALFGLIEMKVKYRDNPEKSEKIEEQINAISSKIAELEAERKKNSINPKKTSAGDEVGNNSLLMGSDSGINPANFDGLSKNRGDILKIVNNGLNQGTITFSEDGPDLSTAPFNKSLSFKNNDEFKSVLKAVDGIYENLKEMGLDVRKVEKSEGEKSASFYAIRFPEAYKGERNIMKMTEEQISKIKGFYENETNDQKNSVNPRNYRIDALGHEKLTMNNELVLNSLGLKKAEEQSVETENLKETNGADDTEGQKDNNLTHSERLELEKKISGRGGRGR